MSNVIRGILNITSINNLQFSHAVVIFSVVFVSVMSITFLLFEAKISIYLKFDYKLIGSI